MTRRRKRVYVIAPWTWPDPITTIKPAIASAEMLFNLGYAPFVPHLVTLWQMFFEHTQQQWLEHFTNWMKLCDLALRVPGKSYSADQEVAMALRLQIPVYFSLEELRRHEGGPLARFRSAEDSVDIRPFLRWKESEPVLSPSVTELLGTYPPGWETVHDAS